MQNILDTIHIGSNKSILRTLLGEFSIINGDTSFLIMSTWGAETGKSYESKLAMNFIPDNYLFKVNDMTKANFSRYAETHKHFFDRLICIFGDLGSQKAYAEMEDVFNILKILITENEYSRTFADRLEDGSFENTKLDLEVSSIGAVFQTTSFDFLDKEEQQLASHTLKLTAANTNKDDVLDLISVQIGFGENDRTNTEIREAKTEIKKFQNYILYLISKDFKIIIPWASVFKRHVNISNTPFRDFKQVLYLF